MPRSWRASSGVKNGNAATTDIATSSTTNVGGGLERCEGTVDVDDEHRRHVVGFVRRNKSTTNTSEKKTRHLSEHVRL